MSNNSPKSIILRIMHENGITFDTKVNKILEEITYIIQDSEKETWKEAYRQGWVDGYDIALKEMNETK